MGILDCVLQQSNLPVIELTGHRGQRFLDALRVSYLTFQIFLQVLDGSLNNNQLVDQEIGKISFILFHVKEATSVLTRSLGKKT